jgi:protein TonB
MGLRLGGFITASLAAHWLVLAGWQQPIAVTASTNTLAVQLTPVEPLAEKRDAPRVEHQAQSSQTQQGSPDETQWNPGSATPDSVSLHTQNTRYAHGAGSPGYTTATPERVFATTVAASEAAGTEPRAEEQNKQTLKTVSFAEAQEGIRNRLNNDLARHFKYPHLARLRSWEGTVLLDLQIETDGKISRITLAQSSGYALLDDNAIATLNRIGSVSGAQQWLEGGNMELQLPVIYRLSDS